jgi:hypothetical protein
VAGATPTAGLGVVEPPPWPRGWSGHPQKPKKKKNPNRPFGVAESTPRSLGVVRPPPKGPNPFFFFGLLGVAGPPPWPWGWFDHPQTGRGGGSSHPRFLPPPPPFFNIFLFLFSFLFFFFKKKLMIKWPKRRRFEAQNGVVLEPKTT